MVWHCATAPPEIWPRGPAATEARTSVCLVCGSYRTVTHRLGEPPQRLAVPTFRASPAESAFLRERHEHDWALSHVNRFNADGDLLSHGDAFPIRYGRVDNPVTAEFNANRRFREWIAERIAIAAVTRDEIVRLMRTGNASPEARAWMGVYEASRR